MCGRYAAALPPELMADLFRLLNRLDYPARFNIKPTEPMIAVIETPEGREGRILRWGFVPFWVKDPRTFPLLINARAEGIVDKPAFRGAIRTGRCVVPASGYFEWMKAPGGKRQPYYITLADGEPMAFAALCSTWRGPEAEPVETGAIVTVPSTIDIGTIHDRMPAVLRGDAIDAWLDPSVPAEEAASLAQPLPEGSFTYHPVGREVGKATAEGPELIHPVPVESDEPAGKKRAGGGQMELF